MRFGPGTQGSVGIVDVLMYDGALASRRAYIPHTATYGQAASIVHTLAVNLGGGLSGTDIYGNSTRRGSYVEVRTGGGASKFVKSGRYYASTPANTLADVASQLHTPGTLLAADDGMGTLFVVDDSGGGADMTVTGDTALLTALGWTSGQTFSPIAAPTPSEVVDEINAQTGGAVTASLDTDGRIVLTKALDASSAASSQSIEIGSGTDPTLAAALGFSVGDTATGTDADDRASVVAKLDAALGAHGVTVTDTGSAFVITSATLGSSSSIELDTSSDATLAAELGVVPGTVATGGDGDTLSTVLAKIASATGGQVTGTESGGVVTLASDDEFTLSHSGGADVLGELGFADGDRSTAVGDPLTLSQAASAIQVALGGAATVEVASDRLKIRSASVGSSSSVAVGAGSDSGVLAELGLTSSDSATGVEGDSASDAVAAIGAALGSEASVALDGSGRLTITTTASGGDAELVVRASSTSGVLDDLGLSAGQRAVGTDAGTQLTASHSAGGSDTVQLQDGAKLASFQGGLAGLRLALDPEVDPGDISGDIDVAYRFPLTVATVDGAAKALERLDEGLSLASQMRSRVGAASRRLEASANHLEATRQALASSRASILDANVAEDLVAFQRAVQVQALQPVARKVAANLSRSTMAALLAPLASDVGGAGGVWGSPTTPEVAAVATQAWQVWTR